MRQVFYIEADEEMISVIGRLRKSPSVQNIIVAPQRSLILQSIVNLRLLNHDAQKNGKEIIIITQDPHSRALCERVGIQTQALLDEEYTQINQSQTPSIDTTSPRPVFSQQAVVLQEMQEKKGSYLPFSDAIGTADFFGNNTLPHMVTPPITQEAPKQKQPIESLSKSSYENPKQIRVHDQNPKNFTTLNSQRFEEAQLLNQQKSFTPPSLRGAQTMRPILPNVSSAPPLHKSSLSSATPPQNIQARYSAGTPESLGSQSKQNIPIPINLAPKTPEKQVVVSHSGKIHAFFIFFGIICVLSVMGVGAYLFLPKADVHIKLKAITQKSDFEFNGSTKTTEYSSEAKAIPMRLIEKDQEISRSFDATGKTSLADQKARGSVTIYNEYSADKQLLVASTRLRSQDGKVFRLLSGITVPGMTTINGKVEPGAIEAVVIADESGQEYNIASTTFTIPGFEGSPKYAKFYAKSSNVMNGGGVSGSDVTVVSDQDIAKAKKTLEADIKDMAMERVNQDLGSGEKTLQEALDIVILSSSASPQVGSVTNTFDYRMKIHIRAFIFSEAELKKMTSVLLAGQNTNKEVTVLSPDAIDMQYGEPTADFSAGTLRINAHAIGRSEPSFDLTQLKNDLLGKNENDIAVLLQKYTQIDSISIHLSPEFFITRVPNRQDRVMITIDPMDLGNDT